MIKYKEKKDKNKDRQIGEYKNKKRRKREERQIKRMVTCWTSQLNMRS
jgi:hypothetical protein